MNKNKLCLGTVQFGCNYGISNKNGQVPTEEVGKILDFAEENGIKTLDTAQGYGESEKVLGNFDLSPFNIITKVIGEINLEKSLENLNVSSVYGLMFHRENELTDKTWTVFEHYKKQGLVEKIGVSVYSPEKLLEIIKSYNIDIVQFPLNLLDQRFLDIMPELKKKNIEIHTRSAFLQGLLLMNIDDIDSYFNEIKPVLKELPKDRLLTALQFVKNIQDVDKIVFGVTKLKELQEIFLKYNEDTIIDYKNFKISDEKFLNPSLWRLNK